MCLNDIEQFRNALKSAVNGIETLNNSQTEPLTFTGREEYDRIASKLDDLQIVNKITGLDLQKV